MISLRHHLLTIVAVFLALAAGIVLGGGPLSDVTEPTSASSAPDDGAAAPAPQAAYGEGFAAAVSPTLLSGRLAEQQVALVTIPGADEQLVDALVQQVEAAGGAVSTRLRLTEAMVDPAQKSLVDTLGSQLMTQQGDAVPVEASTYDRMGQLLGLTVATTKPEGEELTGKGRAITDAATGAALVEPVEEARRAPLVLLVLGPDAGDPGSDAILSGLAAGLGRQALGAVVAGVTADGAEGQLGRLRADPAAAELTTVDGIDTAAGRAATVLALQRALSTRGGAFGASGADGPVPLG